MPSPRRSENILYTALRVLCDAGRRLDRVDFARRALFIHHSPYIRLDTNNSFRYTRARMQKGRKGYLCIAADTMDGTYLFPGRLPPPRAAFCSIVLDRLATMQYVPAEY